MSDVVETVESLLHVADFDTAYRRRYLQRAERLLDAALPAGEYARLGRAPTELDQLSAAAERAAAASDWAALTLLARRADALRSRLAARQDVLDLRGRLSQTAPVTVSPFGLTLHGLAVGPRTELQTLRNDVIGRLAGLEKNDRELAGFYAERRRYFEHHRVGREVEAAGMADAERSAAQEALEAALAGRNWSEVERLARALAASGEAVGMRDHDVRPSTADDLADPFPASATANAARLGLAPVTVPEAAALHTYVCCKGVGGPQLSEEDAKARQAGSLNLCDRWPPEITGVLKETIDLLMLQAFITSSGMRYLPPFARETVLVELFPEDALDAMSPLLEVLHLPQRRARSRLEIEEAVRRYEDDLLSELAQLPQLEGSGFGFSGT